MRYKVKWKARGEGPITPEIFDSEDAAKARVRQLINEHPRDLVIDVWDEDETWQIVTSAGIAEWCKA
jgi:hypothetical protein